MTEYVIVDENGEPLPEESAFGSLNDAKTVAARISANRIGSYHVTEVETAAENNSDDDTPSMNYDFLTADTDAQSENTDDTDDRFADWDWSLGNHSTVSEADRNSLAGPMSATISNLDDDVDGETKDILKDALDAVTNTNVSDFECPHEDCGLGHGHHDGKHDIRSDSNASPIAGFDITDRFAEQMEFVPYCHCGANEAAMLVKFYPYIDGAMFNDSERFEGVDEVEPDVLERLYQVYTQGSNGRAYSFSRACATVANEKGLDESLAIPLGVREDVKAFFDRRSQIEGQADSAPIGAETRAVINESRDANERLVA
jgi:hypothetical protein